VIVAVTPGSVRRKARVALILRARVPRDGDGDGFYDPDGKGPLPDKTPLPPRVPNAVKEKTRPQVPKRAVTDFDSAMRSGVKSQEELSGGGMSRTILVHYNNGTDLIEKRMRDAATYASATHQAEAEHLASVLGEAIGARVPPTRLTARDRVLMGVAPGRAELARYLEAEAAGRVDAHARMRQAAIDSDEGRLLGILDLLIDNDDRNPGNWLLDDDGTAYGIDHALAWDPQRVYGGRPDLSVERNPDGDGYVIVGPNGPLSEVYEDEYEAQDWIESWWDLDELDLRPDGASPPRYEDGGTLSPFAAAFARPTGNGDHQWIANDLAPADVEWLRSRIESVRDQFAALDRLDWYRFALQRLAALAHHARGTRVRWAT
jgi:hypothetical protein